MGIGCSLTDQEDTLNNAYVLASSVVNILGIIIRKDRCGGHIFLWF